MWLLRFPPLFLALFLVLPHPGSPGAASESEARTAPGIQSAKLLTPARSVVPGSRLTVGLLLSPLPEFHTYWRGPGIVGVATSIEWTLPKGFEAGEILWPAPEKTDMAGITANGYRSEVILLTEIDVPGKIDADSITIEARAAWMACSTSCHPSIRTLALQLPVAEPESAPERDESLAERFEEIRKALPVDPPEHWHFRVSAPARDRIVLSGTIPGSAGENLSDLVFFSDDMQVDSDQPQRVEIIPSEAGGFRMHFSRPDFAPEEPGRFSGVLWNPGGWGAFESEFIEISIPWDRDTKRHG